MLIKSPKSTKIHVQTFVGIHFFIQSSFVQTEYSLFQKLAMPDLCMSSEAATGTCMDFPLIVNSASLMP